MKAFFITEPNMFALKEIEKPAPKNDEVLVKVRASGFCGTDIHTFKGEHPTIYPIIPGHEFSGIVEEIGASVTTFKNGDAVIADPNIFCENCYYCKQNMQIHCENIKVLGNTMNGAFAEYVIVPERCLFHADKIDFICGAMAEPLACVINSYNKASVPLGGSVLIYGAGTIGLMHLMICLRAGASTITIVDIKPAQLEIAKTIGANHAFMSDANLERKLKEIQPRGYSYVVDASGVPEVIEKAIPHLAKSGTFIAFGACPEESKISINPFHLYYNDWKLIGSYALEKTMPQSIALLKDGGMDLSVLIGKTITLDEMPKHFLEFCQGKTNNKIIVKFE
ncbi:MAG: zinc-dependent alcohol dehydrogenase family protein [Lachnospiraceae bacterium]|nr:zinc-dependent alcohol dehydrogenase family protein [Lachnospiraceae bacterium]